MRIKIPVTKSAITKWLLALSLTLAQTQAGATVLVQAQSTSNADFQSLVDVHSGTLALSDLQKTGPDAATKDRLERDFMLAEQEFFAENSKSAIEKFNELVKTRFSQDWQKPERQVLAFSLLRLAQLSGGQPEKKEWFLRAAEFFPQFEAAGLSFDEKTLAEWKQMQAQIKRQLIEVNVGDLIKNYRSIKVDGEEFDLTLSGKVWLSTGSHRVSFISDRLPYHSQILSATQLAVYQPPSQFIAAGDCDRPTLDLKNLPNIADAEVVYGPLCSYRSDIKGNWQKNDRRGNAAAPNLARSESDPTSREPKFAEFSGANTNGLAAPAKSNFPTWMKYALAGLAVGLGLAVYENNHRPAPQVVTREETVPTERRTDL